MIEYTTPLPSPDPSSQLSPTLAPTLTPAHTHLLHPSRHPSFVVLCPWWWVQVAQALLVLFVKQYVHLDLKWDNVVLKLGATATDPPLAVVRGALGGDRCRWRCAAGVS